MEKSVHVLMHDSLIVGVFENGEHSEQYAREVLPEDTSYVIVRYALLTASKDID